MSVKTQVITVKLMAYFVAPDFKDQIYHRPSVTLFGRQQLSEISPNYMYVKTTKAAFDFGASV